MASFAPPPGPPPPQVPEGWKAQFDKNYNEWFYVNTRTNESQWEKPTQPAYAPGNAPPPGAPPGYGHSSTSPTGAEKGAYSNNPYNQSSPNNLTEDERLARKLQDEENTRGASDSYYGQGQQQSPAYGQQAPAYGQQTASPYGQQSTYGQQSPYGQEQQLPPREPQSSKGGLFGKLAGKFGGGSSRPTQGYGQQGYPPQQYGGGYGGGGYGGYPQQQPQRAGRMGGMGAGGGALLGAGAGLVGGALLMDAVEDHDQNEYNQGYEQGQDNGGGDNGGGDNGGGDYGGGDDGGGDMGGGDMGGGDF